jgi:hypothetical protein
VTPSATTTPADLATTTTPGEVQRRHPGPDREPRDGITKSDLARAPPPPCALVDRRRYPTPHAVIAARLHGRVEDPVEGFVYEPLPMAAALRRLLGRLASV